MGTDSLLEPVSIGHLMDCSFIALHHLFHFLASESLYLTQGLLKGSGYLLGCPLLISLIVRRDASESL